MTFIIVKRKVGILKRYQTKYSTGGEPPEAEGEQARKTRRGKDETLGFTDR